MVEIGDEAADDMGMVSRQEENLCSGGEIRKPASGYVVDESLDGFGSGEAVVYRFIRHPLRDVEEIRIKRRWIKVTFESTYTEIIEAFEGTGGGGTDGDDVFDGGKKIFESRKGDRKVFGMHMVSSDKVALNGTEGSGADVEGDFLTVNVSEIKTLEDTAGEMQSGSGGGDRPFDAGIDGLVGTVILRFGITIQVRG